MKIINEAPKYPVLLRPIVLVLLLSLLAVSPAVAGSQIYPAGKIREIAEKFLLSKLPWKKEQINCQINYEGGPLVLPQGLVTLSPQLPGRQDRAGRLPLVIKITVGDHYQRRIRLSADVQIHQTVIKTTRQIKRGDILSSEDVEVENITTIRPQAKALRDLIEVVGYRAARNIPRGRAVTANFVVKPPLIEKGDPVTIVVKKGFLKITAPGIAREKGFKGEFVEVSNVQSKKTVFARVVDDNTVEVRF
jgi:flagella basal body P-ring formation protein FlgA